ncbi:MAG: DoxX family protein [Planctomycetota bacterium]|nr:MAG: DoxX family protein [Planctomycetota bacterium]
MSSEPPPAETKPRTSLALQIAGWVLGALPALFMIVNGAISVTKPPFVVEGTTEMGMSESVIVPLGVIMVTCSVLYLIPYTAVLGAILLTGYLGGAVATHVLHGDGWFEMLFPVLFGALFWLGLYLRDARIRAIVPIRR